MYINADVVIGLEKDWYETRDADRSDKMFELTTNLEGALELYKKLSIYFDAKNQKMS